MPIGIVNPTDFSTALEVGNKLSKAFLSGDFIAGSSPKDQQFIVASVIKGAIVDRINGNKGIVGPFSYHNQAIFTPIYYKPTQITQTGSEEILTAHKEDMFGATSMHFLGGYLFVISNNGFYIFDEKDYSLIASFKNTTPSTVSHINYYYNKETNLLYLANIKEERGRFLVICADAKEGFKEKWRTTMDGELSKSGGLSVNTIYESKKYIVCPIFRDRKSLVALIDKKTGATEREIATNRNLSIVYNEEKMYAKGFRENEIVCFDLQTLNEKWACKYPGCKGDLVLYKNQLLSGCSKKGTFSVGTESGEATLFDKKMNIKPVLMNDLRPSLQYYIVDTFLCW